MLSLPVNSGKGSGLFAEDPNALLCPVDGTLGEYGIIRDGNLLQAKGLEYRLEDLLQDPERKDLYDGGHYIHALPGAP